MDTTSSIKTTQVMIGSERSFLWNTEDLGWLPSRQQVQNQMATRRSSDIATPRERRDREIGDAVRDASPPVMSPGVVQGFIGGGLAGLAGTALLLPSIKRLEKIIMLMGQVIVQNPELSELAEVEELRTMLEELKKKSEKSVANEVQNLARQSAGQRAGHDPIGGLCPDCHSEELDEYTHIIHNDDCPRNVGEEEEEE